MADETKTRRRRSLADLLGEPIAPSTLDKIEIATGLLGGEGGDTANGFAFLQRFGATLCYVPEIRTWLAYSGGVWAPADAEVLMQEFCAESVNAAADRLRDAVSQTRRNDVTSAENAVGIATRLFKSRRAQEQALAQARPHMTIPAARFNRTPHLLGVRNGVLDLLRSELVRPPAGEYISKQMGCSHDPTALAPLWERFICEVLPDAEERAFFQQCIGAALFGVILDNGIVFMLGESGDNGKSVACNVMTRLFGSYCMIAGADLLLQTKHDSETKRLYAGLSMGPRLVLINEIPKGAVWDDKKLKDIASRDDLQTRKLFGEVYSFTPTHHVFVRGNHAPGSQDNGDAFWKRILPVTFGVQIPKSRQVAGLDDKIVASELPGVLNWALEGARAWREAGKPSGSLGRLVLPQSVKEARERYRATTDYFTQWLHECTEEGHEAKEPRVELWQSYRSFLLASGLRGTGLDREFYDELQRRGYVRGAVRGVRVFRGLRLKGAHFDE